MKTVWNHIRPSAFKVCPVTSNIVSPPAPWHRGHDSHQTSVMKIERFAGYHEASEALVLSIAGVTAIMLIESLILLILY
jgi:hypothetical protein